jgi:hypothetical protein
MLHISDLHLGLTQSTASQESASFRLQCAAEFLENIKTDLRECVKMRQNKPTLCDHLNTTQAISPIDPAVSFCKSKILEEKMEQADFAHRDFPGNKAVNSPQVTRFHQYPASTRSALELLFERHTFYSISRESLTACAGITFTIMYVSVISQLRMEQTLGGFHFQNFHEIIMQEKRQMARQALSWRAFGLSSRRG